MKKYVLIENIEGASCPDCGPNINKDLATFETREDAQEFAKEQEKIRENYFYDIIEIDVD